MKKKFITVVLIIALTMSCIYAEATKKSSSVLFQDIAIRVGTGRFVFDEHSKMGANFLGGITVGLTARLEFALEAITPLVPDPLSEVTAGFDLSYDFLGDRVYSTNNAGNGLNTLLSLGLFFSDHNHQNQFLPTFLTLRLTPLTVGSPYSGRREHIIPFGVAWNFQDNTFSLFVSLIMYDNYIKGTWRDYE